MLLRSSVILCNDTIRIRLAETNGGTQEEGEEERERGEANREGMQRGGRETREEITLSSHINIKRR